MTEQEYKEIRARREWHKSQIRWHSRREGAWHRSQARFHKKRFVALAPRTVLEMGQYAFHSHTEALSKNLMQNNKLLGALFNNRP